MLKIQLKLQALSCEQFLVGIAEIIKQGVMYAGISDFGTEFWSTRNGARMVVLLLQLKRRHEPPRLKLLRVCRKTKMKIQEMCFSVP